MYLQGCLLIGKVSTVISDLWWPRCWCLQSNMESKASRWLNPLCLFYVVCICAVNLHTKKISHIWYTQVAWQNNSEAKEHRRHSVRQKGKCYKSKFRFLVVCAFSLTNKQKTHQIGINYITTYYTKTAIWLLLLTSSLTGAGSPTVDVNDRLIAIGVGINK